MPQDENDLAYFLQNLAVEIPVTVIGAGSNLIVRDGGVPGVVIRLGRGFNEIKVEADHRIAAGTAMLDVMVARAAQAAGIAGLAFFSGIPGSIGGALRMNGGAYGAETKDVLIEARGIDRRGAMRSYSNPDMGFSYRHCGVPDDVIFTAALFQGRAGDPEAIAAEMAEIKGKRDKSQPRNRTGGSAFKNPPGQSAWKLVDEAGCRGLKVGQAQVSELHSNFLISRDGASAADIETLGETVRARVKAHSGIELEWEIKRIGIRA
jgi:UDP-N-acetylmuramate dehydrogenase